MAAAFSVTLFTVSNTGSPGANCFIASSTLVSAKSTAKLAFRAVSFSAVLTSLASAFPCAQSMVLGILLAAFNAVPAKAPTLSLSVGIPRA